MHIRPETPDDHGAIREVNIAAFAVHPYSHQTEHLIVEALRADGALAVSLVAEDDGAVLGHIAFSLARINGEESKWYLLGPVAVFPEHQRRGVGSALVRAGLETIRELGAEGCVLVGDPVYYTRFGFRQAAGLVLEGVPPEYFMSYQMTDRTPHGKVEHHPAFGVEA